MIYADVKYKVRGHSSTWRLTDVCDGYGLMEDTLLGSNVPYLVVELDQPTFNQLYTIQNRTVQMPTIVSVAAETMGSLADAITLIKAQRPAEMDCSVCPKRKLCSGADCYYEHYPEKIPSRELLEDKALLDATEGRDAYAEQK